MKKITILFLFAINIVLAQSWSTGTLVLNEYSAKFDVDPDSDTVTLTMIGPDDVWMGIAPGASDVSGMGESGDDVIVYSSTGLDDRRMRGVSAVPFFDRDGIRDHWTLVSDNVASRVRTVIATRALDTGADQDDFVFPEVAPTSPLLFLMAHGNVTRPLGGFVFFSPEFSTSHGGANKASHIVTDFTLSSTAEDFNFKTGLNFYPNPANDVLNINVSDLYNNTLQIEVFDILGNNVITNNVNDFQSQLSISGLNSGVYLLKLSSKSSKDYVVKKFIKI